MARFFDNDNTGPDYIQGVVAFPVYPFTINLWCYPEVGRVQAAFHNVTDSQRYILNINASSQFLFNAFTTNNALATASGTVTTNAWNMLTAVGSSATSRSAYLNAGAAGTSTTNRTITTPNRWLLGGNYSAGVISGTTQGRICELAIWNVALTTAEIASLQKGCSANLVRPQSLIAYYPAVRESVDYHGGTTTFTVNNTTLADHTRRYG